MRFCLSITSPQLVRLAHCQNVSEFHSGAPEYKPINWKLFIDAKAKKPSSTCFAMQITIDLFLHLFAHNISYFLEYSAPSKNVLSHFNLMNIPKVSRT